MLFQREIPRTNIFGVEVPQPHFLIDFLGFEKHLVQIRAKRGVQIWPGWYDHAAYYAVDLPPEKLFGPGQEVPLPFFVKAPDYEFEIGCLIGKSAHLTDEKEALHFFQEHCWLTILNDWSARDVQKKDMEGLGPTNSKFILGKSIGPKLVPARDFKMDENGVLNMEMILRLNGEERSRSNYSSIYHTHPGTGKKGAWSFPRLFTWLGKQNIALSEGYLLGSGTIGDGCIAEFSAKIDPKTGDVLEPALYPWLADGDVVTMEAEGIGVLENKVKIAAKKLATAK